MKGEAKFIRELSDWQGDARLYELLPAYKTWDERVVNRVIVSAVDVPHSGPETYIFAADLKGEPETYVELEGSFRGGLDHAEALSGLGYDVASA